MKHNDTKLQGPENATGRVAGFHGFSDQAVRRLTLLDSAETLGDLAGLPSNRLEALRGGRAGQLAPEGPRRWLLAPLCWIAMDADGHRWMRVRLWGNSGGTIQIPRADELLATTTYGLFI